MFKETTTVVWYKSKTLWVNLIGIIVLVVQSQTGFVIDPSEQMAILAVINLIVRAISHGGSITLRDE